MKLRITVLITGVAMLLVGAWCAENCHPAFATTLIFLGFLAVISEFLGGK